MAETAFVFIMWRIAVKHEAGISEIKAANPEIKNPDLIYPGQVLTVPTTDSEVSSFEAEVVRLVNIERNKDLMSLSTIGSSAVLLDTNPRI